MTRQNDNLYEIFYSGPFADQGDYTALEPIQSLLDDGHLSLETVDICNKATYLDTAESVSKSFGIDDANGSHQHQALAILAKEWLRRERNQPAKTEQSFYGYYPDVLTDDHQTIVECGNTGNPEKLLQYFSQGRINNVIQIPYPTYDDPIVQGYVFTASNGIIDAIKKLKNESKADILTIINRPNR